jgi:adenine-specific DNA-methyltransferase
MSEEKRKDAPSKPTRAELVWDGKYDAHGRRVAPVRAALPFQTVETVNESVQERQKNLLFESPGAYAVKEWRNRLIWGDKKYVLPSLLAEFAGKVNLIYIDPPFDTGADFSFTATVPSPAPSAGEGQGEGDDSQAFTKEPSIIEQKAYRDTWGRGLDSYLQWFYETVVLLHELLHETGSLYVHLDWHVGHYAKVVLDEVFGSGNYLNQIVWHYRRWTAPSKSFQKLHDLVLVYTKTENYTFNQLLTAYTEGSVARKQQGVLHRFKRGEEPILVSEREVKGEGVPENDVWQIPFVAPSALERVGYPTQKPEKLLERVIQASSNPGDLVLDAFCGSGTTAAVAEKLGRRWITCDLGRFAIHTARKRLLSIAGVRPFVVQNLGKYERQLWQEHEFNVQRSTPNAQRSTLEVERSKLKVEASRSYVEFILKLYQAKPIHGYTWLHGVRGGRLVHVGSVDAPVSVGDVTQMAAEFRKAVGTGKDAPKSNGVDVLGWDFAFEMNEVAKQQAAKANIQMRFFQIPRDVMDKRAAQQGDVKFFELAALAVATEVKKQEVALRLTDFVIPPDDVPEEVRKAVKHWSQWIDYWAVDWDNQGDTFHNQWQAYRTRKDNTLALETSHTYAEKGEYAVVVKVIDILGNDTTKTVKVRVKG